MTLATLDEVLRAAEAESRAVGAFNIIQIEHAEAFVAAAERTGLPVVLQISQNTVGYHGALAPIALATKALAAAASARCVLQLDHALNESLIDEAVNSTGQGPKAAVFVLILMILVLIPMLYYMRSTARSLTTR